MDEQKLAAALRKGERRALDRAVERYTPYLSAVVRRTLGAAGTAQDVEELVSDVFLTLWRHREELRDGSGLRPWLAAVARNRAVDWLRAARPAPLPLEDQAGAAAPDLQEEAERREFAAALYAAVEALPQPERDLVEGYYYQGERLKDLARGLGLSPAAAKSRLFRARQKLKEALTKGGAACGANG